MCNRRGEYLEHFLKEDAFIEIILLYILPTEREE